MSQPKGPPVIQTPKSMDEFAKFDRSVSDALSQIVTDAPSGPVPPVATAGVDAPVLMPNNTVVAPPAARGANAEEQALLAHRAFIRAEEERLAARTERIAPLAPLPTNNITPGLFGSAGTQVMIRQDADPVHVASYNLLTRIIAGAPQALGMFPHDVLARHIAALRDRIEYKPPTEPVAPPTVASGTSDAPKG